MYVENNLNYYSDTYLSEYNTIRLPCKIIQAYEVKSTKVNYGKKAYWPKN